MWLLYKNFKLFRSQFAFAYDLVSDKLEFLNA